MSTPDTPQAKIASPRGWDTTRLDTFVDAAFAFGSTVLLISHGALPRDYPSLVALIQDVPAFVLSFAALMFFWLQHRSWRRDFGLETPWTVALTLLLVVTVLVYIYPLKLLLSLLLAWLSGGSIGTGFRFGSSTEVLTMLRIYNVGFTCLSGAIFGLFWTTLRERELLALQPEELCDARVGASAWGLTAAVGLLSTLLAFALPLPGVLFTPFVYWMLPAGVPYVTNLVRRRYKTAEPALELA